MFCPHCRHHFSWEQRGENRMKDTPGFFTESDQDFMKLESVKEELYKVTDIGLNN